MKDRIVIWGQDEKDTDVLIAIRLHQNSDIIKLWTFPKKGIDEAFVKELFRDWKDGAEDSFPQPFTLVERGISEENMLPEGLKTPKTDVIKIAEQEWRVRVLSYRLYEHIKQQIEQLKVRVGNLTVYSSAVWAEAKDVSKSIKENTLDRNIKREQTTELRKAIDEVFDELKKLQNAEKSKYLEISKTNMVAIRSKVTEVLEKIGTERHTRKLWDKLLAFQQEAKGQEMTPRDRNALRLKFNEAFGALKANIQSNVGSRITSRIGGLKNAIGKMESSIKRDKDSISYQSGRINKNSTTQLEYQLRSAKLKLIEDRIVSKEQKLHDMYLTLKELEKKSDKLPKAKKVQIESKPKTAAKPAAVAAEVGKEAVAVAKTPLKQTEPPTANVTPKVEALNEETETVEEQPKKDANAEVKTVSNETLTKEETVVTPIVATPDIKAEAGETVAEEVSKTEETAQPESKVAEEVSKIEETAQSESKVVEEVNKVEETAQTESEVAEEVNKVEETIQTEIKVVEEVNKVEETAQAEIKVVEEVNKTAETAQTESEVAEEVNKVEETIQAETKVVEEVNKVEETTQTEIKVVEEVNKVEEAIQAESKVVEEVNKVEETTTIEGESVDDTVETKVDQLKETIEKKAAEE